MENESYGLKNYFVIFSILIMSKIAFVHYTLFEEVHFLFLLTSDFLAVSLLFIMIELIGRRLTYSLYFLLNTVISFLLFAIVIYYKYYGMIPTYHSLSVANQAADVTEVVAMLFEFKFLWLFVDLVFLAVFWKFLNGGQTELSTKNWAIAFLIVVIGNVAMFFIRFEDDVLNENKLAQTMGIIPFQFSYLVDEQGITNNDEITNEYIRELKELEKVTAPEFYGIAKDKNLIIVQLESFQNFVIDLEVEGQKITPVLNNLIKESIYFPYFHQQIGRGNTADAEFVVNTSIHPVGQFAMPDKYSDRDIPSLPKLLSKNGYKSATFHSNSSEFWNRNEMYPALGFDQYYDKPFFGENEVITYGASDEILYKKTVPVLADMKSNGNNFYAHIISLSSHAPFELPAEKRMLKFSNQYTNNIVGGYLQAAHYADYALGTLIEELKNEEIWEDTILVIYGDHMGLTQSSLSENEKSLMNELLGFKYTASESFNVPLIMSIPGMEEKVVPNLGGMVDVMPTVANLMGINLDDHIHFGQDLLNNENNIVGLRFYMSTGSFYYDNKVFIVGESYEDGKLYDITSFNEVEKNDKTYAAFKRNLEILQLSDQYVENLPMSK